MGSAASSHRLKSQAATSGPPEPASLPLATTERRASPLQVRADGTILPIAQVTPLWLSSESVEAPDGSDVYAGEYAILNDGVLGYDQLTLDRAAAGDQAAQMMVRAADVAANAFKRDAPLALTEQQLETIAPKCASASAPDCCCSVCQEPYASGELRRCLPCGHEFHAECIQEWLTRDCGSCPVCRVRLQPSLSELEKRACSESIVDAEALAIAEFSLSLNPVAEDSEAQATGTCSSPMDELVSDLVGARAAELAPILFDPHLAALRKRCQMRSQWTPQDAGKGDYQPTHGSDAPATGGVGFHRVQHDARNTSDLECWGFGTLPSRDLWTATHGRDQHWVMHRLQIGRMHREGALARS